MAALLPFWSIAGEVHQLDGWPESLEDWSRGEIIDSERLLLLNAVESAMGHQVASTRVLSQDMNLVCCCIARTSASGLTIIYTDIGSSF